MSPAFDDHTVALALTSATPGPTERLIQACRQQANQALFCSEMARAEGDDVTAGEHAQEAEHYAERAAYYEALDAEQFELAAHIKADGQGPDGNAFGWPVNDANGRNAP